MARSGGTQLYCPNCKGVRTCRVTDYHTAKDWTGEPGSKRYYRTNHPDIQWFRRVRECLSCNEIFTTAEINEGFLSELVRLREKVGELGEKISQHKVAALAAGEALSELTSAFDLIVERDSSKPQG